VLDYAGLADRVARLAGGLTQRLELAPGERVALVMGNVPEYVEVLFACWHAGLAAVPVNAKLHPAELRYILDHSGAGVCFATADLWPPSRRRPHPACAPHRGGRADHRKLLGEPIAMAEVAPSDLAWLFYTSGTTGQPKGAMLTHRNLAVMSLNYFVDFDRIACRATHPPRRADEPWLGAVDAAACGGRGLQRGARVGRLRAGRDLFPDARWPGSRCSPRPPWCAASPTMAATTDTANLKLITYGGAPMYVEDTLAALDRFGPKLAQLYGQGESPMTITHLSREDHARDHPRWRLGTAGVADSVASRSRWWTATTIRCRWARRARSCAAATR
jgi:long-chain acyl-CoA synthetase